MQSSPLTRLRRRSRRGLTTPAVALALVVVMGGLALILDRLWLDAADLELTTAAESAALAAARRLADDDLLRPDADQAARQQAAREAAAWIASQNFVAGMPVTINSEPEGDVRLGKLVLDQHEKQVRFEETDNNPTTAVVTAQRTRATSNPVGLFVAGLTRIPFGDVVSRAEATIDNRIVGVRPLEGSTVPALPLAICLSDSTGQNEDTWAQQIDSGNGKDQYGVDTESCQVYLGPDGIPEITLRSRGRDESTSSNNVPSNVMVLDIGTAWNEAKLARQFASGLTTEDLEAWDGQLRISPSHPEQIPALPKLMHADREALRQLVGQPRICLLFSESKQSLSGSSWQAVCNQLAAIRVIAVRDQSDGSCELVVQPCVLATRTALLSEQTPYHSGQSEEPTSPSPNRYIYRLRLTQ